MDDLPAAIDFPKLPSLRTIYELESSMRVPRLVLQMTLNSFGCPVLASDGMPTVVPLRRKAVYRIADRLKKGFIRKVLVVRWVAYK